LHPLETYLARLGEIRATERGTPELSYRAALENLLNAVDGALNSGASPSEAESPTIVDSAGGRGRVKMFQTTMPRRPPAPRSLPHFLCQCPLPLGGRTTIGPVDGSSGKQ
jgi:hypothetical protein